MSTTDTPEQGFRLSQLLYDSRYRSITIQVVAFLLFAWVLWELVDNTIKNLSALGKDFDFGFLGQPAGYDISQRLIDYDNQMSHGRAAMAGILNTLLVAFLGCVTATVVGVFAGVMRLSKNWIVSRLMAVYVEAFRNVPLLLWIVLIFAIVTESTAHPKAFKSGEASMLLNSFAVTNRGTYIPGIQFDSPLGSVGLSWLIVLAAIIGAVAFGRWLKRRADRIQEQTGERPATLLFRLVAFVLPLAALWVILGAHFDLPELKGFNFKGGIHLRNSLIALWIALALYTGAFIAEIVRGGILSVSKGQSEAASALGLRPNRTMNLVILPQALRVIIPPLISQYLNLTKNSSLAIAVGYMDARATLGGITISQTGRELEGMLLVGLFYLVVSLVISLGMNLYNNSVKLKER